VFTILATVGIILAALYVLLMYQRTMQGPPRGVLLQTESPAGPRRPGSGRPGHGGAPRVLDRAGGRAARLRVLDLDRRELAVVTPLVALIIALGVYPQPLLDLIEPGGQRHHERRRATRTADTAHHRCRTDSERGMMPTITAPTSPGRAGAAAVRLRRACVGVLVEAFAPRDTRHPVQVAVALVGTLGGSGLHAAAGRHPRGHRRRRARRRRRRAVPAGDDRRAGRAGDPAVRRAGARPGPVGVRGTVGRGPGRQPARPRAAHLRPGCRPRSTRWHCSPSAA
jgi:hypothetical protein